MEDSKKSIELGGRRFVVPADRSIANDLWVEAQVRAAGLADLHVGEGEDARQFALRTVATALGSGQIFPVLGGILHPEGLNPSDWTPALATETGEHLMGVSDAGEKAAIRVMVAQWLSDFFLIGLASATTSATSSTTADDRSESVFLAPSQAAPTVVH